MSSRAQGARQTHGLYHRRKPLGSRHQGGEVRLGKRRGQSRSLARLEPQLLAKRVRHDENVRKQYGAVEAEAPDRLERDLAGRCAVVAKLEKTAFLRAQVAIFRQIAPGLTHQPDWRNGRLLAMQDGEQRRKERSVCHQANILNKELRESCWSLLGRELRALWRPAAFANSLTG
jgi:hypothetical protein